MPGSLADSDLAIPPRRAAGVVEDTSVTTKTYSRSQKLLHWLSAVVILWALFTGFYVALAPVSPEMKGLAGWINVSLTTLLIPVFAWRCFLAWRHRIPHLQPQPLMTRLAGWVHVILYLMIGMVLLTGVLMMERPIAVFDWFTLPQPLKDPALTSFFHTVHIASCAVLAALVGLHIAAVVKHSVKGKSVLGRML